MPEQTLKMKVLILVTVWPEPESSAAGWRVMNVIDACHRAGWSVTIGSPSVTNFFSERLPALGVQVHPVALNDSSFDEWIAGESFDIAILDRFILEEQFGWRIAEFSPQTLRVLDTEDLHFLRRARQKAHQNSLSTFENPIELQTPDACREIASIYRSDLTLVLSDFEKNLLQERFEVPKSLLSLFRFCYSDFPPTPSFEERSDFVAIGNFRHPPNADATLWLKKEIWPKMRAKLPKAEIHIYGAYPSKDMMDLSSPKEGFIVKGPALNAHETLKKYRVNLAPLRFGAGIKGKIADGWRAGTPVVTTPIGAEGMGYESEALRTPDEIAARAVELHLDAAVWKRAREKGHEIARDYFSFERNADQLILELKNAHATRAERRKKNFIGQMLAHHSLQSTKYFSRWIELKERGSQDSGKNTDPSDSSR